MPTNYKLGFTLLELSIVLVIIGLIVGGVVAGQNLIRNAELNSIHSNFTQIKIALNNYRFKYNALPGVRTDFNMAIRSIRLTHHPMPMQSLITVFYFSHWVGITNNR